MPDAIVDLRSDTMTTPTAAMRSAMADARVGDDVYGEDPTINELQNYAAEVFGREAALYVPSGTMANQIALKTYCRPGQEVICEERAHIFKSELGMMAAFGGCLVRPMLAKDGILTWPLIASEVRIPSGKYGGTALITLENTANFAGGTVYSAKVTTDICTNAHKHKVPVFLDGARIFNAAVALDTSVTALSKDVDALMFSLSKGLGGPVGSILLGTADFIGEARQLRKMLGGGMRQAGILAAAGLIALKEGPSKLHVDHKNARFLATELADTPGLVVDPQKVATNIVVIQINLPGVSALELVSRLKSEGVLVNPIRPDAIRLVTHCDVDSAGCERALKSIRQVIRSCAGTA